MLDKLLRQPPQKLLPCLLISVLYATAISCLNLAWCSMPSLFSVVVAYYTICLASYCLFWLSQSLLYVLLCRTYPLRPPPPHASSSHPCPYPTCRFEIIHMGQRGCVVILCVLFEVSHQFVRQHLKYDLTWALQWKSEVLIMLYLPKKVARPWIDVCAFPHHICNGFVPTFLICWRLHYRCMCICTHAAVGGRCSIHMDGLVWWFGYLYCCFNGLMK